MFINILKQFYSIMQAKQLTNRAECLGRL